MKIQGKKRFYSGIVILFVMFISYFIPVSVESGENYEVVTPLLGVLIFHNAFILIAYLLISVVLILSGLRIIVIK